MRLDEGLIVMLEAMFKQKNIEAVWDKMSVKRKLPDGNWETIISNEQFKEMHAILKAHEDAKEKADESKGSEKI